MPAFLRMFTFSETVIQLGLQYSRIAFSFTFVSVLGITFEKSFQAVGQMKVTMVSMMCGCITNIILDSVMIFGLGPFPEMGKMCIRDRLLDRAFAENTTKSLPECYKLLNFLERP